MNLNLEKCGYLAKVTPAVYKIAPMDSTDAEETSDVQGGWCKADDLCRNIRMYHGIMWNPLDLISRFGLVPEAALLVGGQEVWVLEEVGPGKKVVLREYSMSLLEEFSAEDRPVQFFVPLEWAKEVLWAIYRGARRITTLCDSEGQVRAFMATDSGTIIGHF